MYQSNRGAGESRLIGYSDIDFVGDIDRKSTSGMVYMIGGSMIKISEAEGDRALFVRGGVYTSRPL